MLITGAAGGIGAETARVCAEQGASLVLVDVDGCGALLEELGEGGIRATAHAVDVTDRHAVETLIDSLPELHAVVANAGVHPMDEWQDDDWDAAFQRVIDVNLMGVINVVRASLPRLSAQQQGKVVIVSSLAARMGGLLAKPHYVASKGGLAALVKWLARKAAPNRVNVNAVAPGATATPMTDGWGYSAEGIPLKRLATPREIALPIAFLCSEGADYMCGAMLDVNGGVFMN
ncbi:SDR family NAD(P)-dependent oxidoreductase [Halomonas sp. 3H]|uniref:SDR family NAD(P)-dependent oxidoreductase n=1 Tax=Halomonas sp. 3H TaxID=2952527 RepID=UPI0020B7CD2B|nr:SDR family NAD(P)-dependent oxidoreductase [Halomonas sp. 3H]